jgi:hypothetical protein
MDEEWKDIPGYKGLYQASTLGRIRTCEGKTTSNALYEHRVWKQRILKQKCYKEKKGRSNLRVDLWKDGKHRTWLVARLVALTWCNGYSEGMTVNHKDGNHQNNESKNLEWMSLADNIRHGFDTGLYTSQKMCILENENGEKMIYKSLSEASKSIGKGNGYISGCVIDNRMPKSKDGKRFKVTLV